MLIISNNMIGRMPIPDDAVIRINLAWVKSVKEVYDIVDKLKHNVYLDYPSGRTKPPKPSLNIADALELCNIGKVKYFAVSNVESPDYLTVLVHAVPDGVEVVPKIETEEGVKNLPELMKTGITQIMLDKEDLYVNVGADIERYEKLVEEVRNCGIKVLELVGVCFE